MGPADSRQALGRKVTPFQIHYPVPDPFQIHSKTYFRTTYRGIIEILELSPELREALELKRLPDYSALQKFSERCVDEDLLNNILRRLVKQFGKRGAIAAMDSTGLDSTEASLHFLSCTGRKQKSFVKLAVVVLCGSLLPCAVAAGQGPCNDKAEAPRLLETAQANSKPLILLADAGYDAECIHEFCYDEWEVESYIPPCRRARDGSLEGYFRKKMAVMPDSIRSAGTSKLL